MKILLFGLFLTQLAFAQTKLEKDIDAAYQYAKKGVYWALSNIPDEKSSLNSDLIADDKLYAEVKLYKEVEGVKIESTGFNNSNEVRIIIYKSNDSLTKAGYLKEKDTGTKE